MEINGKPVKFNFSALFRANSVLSSKDGENDGAAQLWLQFVTDDDMAVFNAIKVLAPGLKDGEITAYIDEHAGDYDQLHDELEAELQRSAFFRRAASRWTSLVETYAPRGKAKTEQEKIQQQALNDTLEKMKKSL